MVMLGWAACCIVPNKSVNLPVDDDTCVVVYKWLPVICPVAFISPLAVIWPPVPSIWTLSAPNWPLLALT